MKTYKSHPLRVTDPARIASLVGIVLWSAHYHKGQWSREYRLGCRARSLVERHNEIGPFLLTRWFDALEHYAQGQAPAPKQYTATFSKQVKRTYQTLAKLSESI